MNEEKPNQVGRVSPLTAVRNGGASVLASRAGAKKQSPNPKRTAAPDISGEHWRYCPRCGHELINEKCKLRCPRCHYFMSCSDFD
jgi:hypothetical protein